MVAEPVRYVCADIWHGELGYSQIHDDAAVDFSRVTSAEQRAFRADQFDSLCIVDSDFAKTSAREDDLDGD